MLLSSEYCLSSIWMIRKEHSVHSFQGLPEIFGEGHVLLLIYSLKLCVETADYWIGKAVCLDSCPVLDLI